MKKIYVAHPFGGKDENRQKVEAIIKKLLKKHPDKHFISPIHATGFCYNDIPYSQGMELCFELLSICDELWLCEGWKESKGCNLEFEYALKHGIPIRLVKGGKSA